MSYFKYNAFGLNIETELAIPEFGAETNGTPDVRIRFGAVPNELSNPSGFGRAWQSEPGKILVNVDEVGRFLLVGKEELVIDPAPLAKEEDLRTFILGSIMGAILHARHTLVLHASVISTDKGAVIFSGKSGAGKSTLLASFLKRGYGMLTDDKAAISISAEGEASVSPSFPFARLTKISAAKLKFDVEEKWYRARMGKYVYPVEKFHSAPLRIQAAFTIKPFNKQKLEVEKLGSVESFTAIDKATYRKKFLNSNQAKASHFQNVGIVSNQASVFKVLRPDSFKFIDQLTDEIERRF